MKVLIIDDNERLAARTKDRLKKWYLIDLAFSGEDGLHALATASYDIVLLDLGLPGMSGAEVCNNIKKIWPEVAVLIVSGEDSLLSKVALLDSGADDYITKPFETPELHARIRALLRRKQNGAYREVITIDTLRINPNDRTVSREDQQIKLRRKEYDILEYLCANPGRVLTREMIVNQAWPASHNSWTGSIGVHIKQIRDKVDKPFKTKLIKTVYGLGYTIEVPKLTKERSPHDNADN